MPSDLFLVPVLRTARLADLNSSSHREIEIGAATSEEMTSVAQIDWH